MIDLTLNAIAAGIGYFIGGWIGALAGVLLYWPFGLWMVGEKELERRRSQEVLRREPGE